MVYTTILQTKTNKRNLAVEFEALSPKLDSFINDDSKENFHEYLRSVTSILSNNVYRDKR